MHRRYSHRHGQELRVVLVFTRHCPRRDATLIKAPEQTQRLACAWAESANGIAALIWQRSRETMPVDCGIEQTPVQAVTSLSRYHRDILFLTSSTML